jgi:hypothetical protein
MDPAGPAALCIEIYARLASATKQVTSARAMAGTDSGEDGEAAKIEPTYSNTSDINRASQMLRRLVVCIIQVAVYSVRMRECCSVLNIGVFEHAAQ